VAAADLTSDGARQAAQARELARPRIPALARRAVALTAGWVAGNVRAKAMARRQLGADSARRPAACGSLPEAQRMLAATSYGPAGRPGQSLAAAQRAVAGTLLWDVRVLAGWLPRDGVDLLRAVVGWFELANVDELLRPWRVGPRGPGRRPHPARPGRREGRNARRPPRRPARPG
jgi:hypothetical protein